MMKRLFLAPILAAAMSAGWAAPYAPQEFDFGELDGMEHGIVESVREVRLEDPHKGLRDLFEHSVKPETAAQLVILLDDGRSVVLFPDEMQRFEPGQRVRVMGTTDGARIERE